MKNILIFTLTLLYFASIKSIIDQIPIFAIIFFVSIAILFTVELIKLIQKERAEKQKDHTSDLKIKFKVVSL